MARLVLRVRRGGRLLGSWTLGSQPLEFSIVDLATGAELGSFVAQGADLVAAQPSSSEPSPVVRIETGRGSGVDEVPIDVPARLHGDDFTVPMPEPTGTAGRGVGLSDPADTEEATGRAGRQVPNLARQGRVTVPLAEYGGRVDGDDLTVPLPEPTGSLVDPVDAIDTDRRNPLAPPPGRVSPAEPLHVDEEAIPGLGMVALEDTGQLPEITLGTPLSMSGPVGEVTARQPDPAEVAAHDAYRVASQPGVEPNPVTGSLRRSQGRSPQPVSLAASPPSLHPLDESDPETHEVPAPTEDEQPRIQPAEVWVRKKSEWRSAGRLVSGQRVRMLGAWMRLRADGRLVVSAGPRMAGSGTMVDGRHVEIIAGQDAISLPPGASVLLCFKEHGLYVRSEPLSDSAGAIAYDTPGPSLNG